MIPAPSPSRPAQSSMIEALRHCRAGDRPAAAREFLTSYRVAEVAPSMLLDLLYFARAVTTLGLEQELRSVAVMLDCPDVCQRLLKKAGSLREDPVDFDEPEWITRMYPGGSRA